MKKAYDDAMKTQNSASLTHSIKDMQKEQKKLNDLLKQQKELKERIQKIPTTLNNSDQKLDLKLKFDETNKAIKNQIELLKQNGFHVNETKIGRASCRERV